VHHVGILYDQLSYDEANSSFSQYCERVYKRRVNRLCKPGGSRPLTVRCINTCK